MPHQDLITDDPKAVRGGGIILSAMIHEPYLPMVMSIIGILN